MIPRKIYDEVTQNTIPLAELIGKARKNELLNVYVMNNLDKGGERQTGVFTLRFITQNGETLAYTIPDTFIPVNLLELGDTNAMVTMQDFATACARRLLFVITEEYALKLLATPAAKIESKRLSLMNNATMADEVEEKAALEDRVQPRIRVLMEEEGSEANKVSRLYGMQNMLTKDDLLYVMSKVESPASKEAVADMLKEVEAHPPTLVA